LPGTAESSAEDTGVRENDTNKEKYAMLDPQGPHETVYVDLANKEHWKNNPARHVGETSKRISGNYADWVCAYTNGNMLGFRNPETFGGPFGHRMYFDIFGYV
jgi:hypothetical protein